jgi:hypothetical protein
VLDASVRSFRVAGEIIVAMLVANGRVGMETSAFVGPWAAERETFAGNLLHQTLASWDCCLPFTCVPTQGEQNSLTWRSACVPPHRIDFVAVPYDLVCSVRHTQVLDEDALPINPHVDHCAILVEAALPRVPVGPQARSGPWFKREAFKLPGVQDQLRLLFSQVLAFPLHHGWAASRVEELFCKLSQFLLAMAAPQSVPAPRVDCVSGGSWHLVLATRTCRKTSLPTRGCCGGIVR